MAVSVLDGAWAFYFSVIAIINYRHVIASWLGAAFSVILCVLLLSLTQPVITWRRFYRFIAFSALIFVVLVVGYTISMETAGSTSSANYPGKIIAEQITQQWHQKYHTKLNYIVGPRWEEVLFHFIRKIDRRFIFAAFLNVFDDEINYVTMAR